MQSKIGLYFYISAVVFLDRLSHYLGIKNIFLGQVIIHSGNMGAELDHALLKKISDGLRVKELCVYSVTRTDRQLIELTRIEDGRMMHSAVLVHMLGQTRSMQKKKKKKNSRHFNGSQN